MVGKNVLRIFPMLIFIFLNLSCSASYRQSTQNTKKGSGYLSAFPDENVSNQLEEISNSIFRVSSIAFYRTYTFSDTSRILKADLSDSLINKNTIKSTVIDKPALGTGTLIYAKLGLVAILTCAHVVSFPDTVITYFASEKGIFSDYVQSISVKTKQNVYIAGFPEGSAVEILLKDEDEDIALLGHQFNAKAMTKFKAYSYPFGDSEQLKWGTFVYILGYPLNFKMVASALVSSPSYDKYGSFLLDAPINVGFSGGLILAIKGSIPNFEAVGMIKSVPENKESVLGPSEIDKSFKYSNIVPYKGLNYVKDLKLLNYGIAKVVPMTEVVNYLERNREYLTNMGYDLRIFH